MEWLLAAVALFVAFSNGANDNFKGFATVWGSDTLTYRQALLLATIATVAGSLASLTLANELVQQFSGKGLVPNAVASTPMFIMSVACGAAVTVFLATRLGLPVSTTHALIGGLVGAGFGQSGGEVHFDQLANGFLLPLLVSPVLAAMLGMLAYRVFRKRPLDRNCACLVAPAQMLMPTSDGAMAYRFSIPALVVAADAACASSRAPVRVSVSRSMDRLHILSAMSICFARGVNDTPKLAALLISAHVFQAKASTALIGVAMVIGGLLFARQVAETMSRRVSRMDHAQGSAANLITAALVLFASKLGLPVSTTHVSVGSIAGVGVGAKTLDWHALRNVLLSWIATLPLAAGVAWLAAIMMVAR
jgi:PiT family inorganic phosphate transporter